MEQVGRHIRNLRQKQGLTLDDLSQRTGFSRSFLSEAERGIAPITITALQKIAEALGVKLLEFFSAPEFILSDPTHIVRAAERKKFRIETTEYTVYSRLAGEFPGRVLESVLVTLLPGRRHRVEPYSHPGEEFGFVLEGVLTVFVEDRSYDLGPGDSIHILSTIPHNWENRTDKPVKALWVITPKLF